LAWSRRRRRTRRFRRDDLADSAVKLEAQIKSEAGPVAKTSATLKTDADAAFKRSDFPNRPANPRADCRRHAGR